MAYKQKQKSEQKQEGKPAAKSYEPQATEPQAAPKVKPAPPVCEGCWRWPVFEDKCWYYWNGKKYCTMWSSDPNELPPL